MKLGISLLFAAFALLGISFIIPTICKNLPLFGIAGLIAFCLSASFVLLGLAIHKLFLCNNGVNWYYIPLFLIYFFLSIIMRYRTIAVLHPEHYIVVVKVSYKSHQGISNDKEDIFVQEDDKLKFWRTIKKEDRCYKEEDSIVLFERNKTETSIINFTPTLYDREYYQKAVYFVDGKEFGNDYYYYAKLRPDLSLKNFGLNKLTMNDNLLYYRNINDSIDSQTHKCPDSLQTSVNREMLDSSGYAFYFHGEIVPKEQVFEEVPPAKEYYERYCGKSE